MNKGRIRAHQPGVEYHIAIPVATFSSIWIGYHYLFENQQTKNPQLSQLRIFLLINTTLTSYVYHTAIVSCYK